MTGKVALGLAVVAAFAVLGYVLITRVFTQPPFDREFAICYAPLPQERTAGLSANWGESGDIAIGLNGKIGQSNVPTEPQLNAFLDCVEKRSKGKQIALRNIVRIPPEPVGQVANRWARDNDGPRLAITAGETAQLSLVRIGEAVGTKADVVQRWCEATIACIKCDPPNPTTDTQQVNLSLRPNAPLIRVEMHSVTGDPWPVPPKGRDGKPIAEPWQDIDDQGRRYYLECRSGN